VAFAGGDVEGGAAVEVDAVDVDAFVEQILNSLDVAAARHEEQLHGGVKVLGHGELRVLVLGAPPYRIQRRLPPEAEPLVVPAWIQRGLARELAAEAPPQRPRRELPRDAALQLRGNVFHGGRRRIPHHKNFSQSMNQQRMNERRVLASMLYMLERIQPSALVMLLESMRTESKEARIS